MNIEIENNSKSIDLLQAEFNKDCDVIDQLEEYHEGYFGPRWLISTLLTEKELIAKYGEIIKNYSPYMLISPNVGNIFLKSRKENENYEKQIKRKKVMTFEEGITDQVHPEISQEDYCTQIEKESLSEERVQLILNVLRMCNELEYSRMYKKCFENKSIQEIADEENVCRTSVNKSIISCRKKVTGILAPLGLIKIIISEGCIKEVRI